ncbi:MAG: sugar phosphate isomerase/epimerase [Candidatus Omnitrophota bacterium]
MGFFALSTSWNALGHSDAKELLFEIKQVGFSKIELSFNLTRSMVDGIGRAADELAIKVISAHNYCPIPDGLEREKALPDCFAMSSVDPQERAAAVKFTKRTIDTAAGVGAKAVVLHCGRVELPERTMALISLYEKGLKDTREFRELKSDIIRQRRDKYKSFLDNTLKSLDEINKYAQRRKICLGIETRFYYREIPSFEEIGIILDKFRGSAIFYWHDTGHAQLMENLGMARHKDFLECYADRMLGIHLHDIKGCSDHQPPSRGELDFAMLIPYLKKDTLKVIEAHHPATAEELKEARVYLEKVLDGAA